MAYQQSDPNRFRNRILKTIRITAFNRAPVFSTKVGYLGREEYRNLQKFRLSELHLPPVYAEPKQRSLKSLDPVHKGCSPASVVCIF
jgi:hypothetical protein